MKKLLSILCFMVISSTCLATANFTSPTGVFLVPNVSVDGNTNYESVTLQLNLATNTFIILDATLKDTSFSETALETLTSNGFKIDFFGCANSGFNQITCKTKVVSSNGDLTITANQTEAVSSVFGTAPSLFDNLGREYTANVAAFDETNEQLPINLIQGVPAEVKFIFDNFDIQATSISAFKPSFRVNNDAIEGNFRNISF